MLNFLDLTIALIISSNMQKSVVYWHLQELAAPEGVQKQGGAYQGLIVGSFNSFFMFSYALALW